MKVQPEYERTKKSQITKNPEMVKVNLSGFLGVMDNYQWFATEAHRIMLDEPPGFIYSLTTLVACGPLGPSTMSKLTSSPSLRVLNPSS